MSIYIYNISLSLSRFIYLSIYLTTSLSQVYVHMYRVYIYIYLVPPPQNLPFMIDYSRPRCCKYLRNLYLTFTRGRSMPQPDFSVPLEYSRKLPNIAYSAGSKIQDSSGDPWENLGSRSLPNMAEYSFLGWIQYPIFKIPQGLLGNSWIQEPPE